jgi:DNA-binding NarL/FixJ family response regulator
MTSKGALHMRIIIVDDHALVRTGLSDILRRHIAGASITEAANFEGAVTILARQTMDLAIVDLFIPGEDSFDSLRLLCRLHPELKVVVISASENPAHIRKAIEIGARGYIPKSFGRIRLLEALDAILGGRIFLPDTVSQAGTTGISANGEIAPGTSRAQVLACLTPRQLEILQMVAEGQSNKQIARRCRLSENTIKVHVSAILRALGLSNRTQAGVLMQKLNYRSAAD